MLFNIRFDCYFFYNSFSDYTKTETFYNICKKYVYKIINHNLYFMEKNEKLGKMFTLTVNKTGKHLYMINIFIYY